MATDKIKFDKYILLRYFQEYLPVDKESAYSGGYPFSISGDIRSVPS
jgi:hypothetical protein